MFDGSPATDPDRGRLILHIGFHRTGTGAIQEVLHSSSIKLREHGVVYPEPSDRHPSHHDLALALGFDNNVPQEFFADPAELIERYARICRDLGPGRTAVFSAAAFCTANDNITAFKRLETFVSSLPLTPTILAVVRPPIDYVVSLYHHHLLSHDSIAGFADLTFKAWLDASPWSDEPIPAFAFDKRLQIWRDHFDDVRVADLCELATPTTSLIEGVLRTAGLHCEVDRPNHRANVGVHPYLADAVRGLRANVMHRGEAQQAIDQLLRIGSLLPQVDAADHYLGPAGKAALAAALDAQIAAVEGRAGVPA